MQSALRWVRANIKQTLLTQAGGERFEDPAEQRLLDGILSDTEAKYGWPTQHLRQQLRQAWQT